MKIEVNVHRPKIRSFGTGETVAIIAEEGEHSVNIFMTPEQAIEHGKKLYSFGTKAIAIRRIQNQEENIPPIENEATENA